jgi:hypothetical protein
LPGRFADVDAYVVPVGAVKPGELLLRLVQHLEDRPRSSSVASNQVATWRFGTTSR